MAPAVPFPVEGTPFTVVECDWEDDLVRRFLETVKSVWAPLPAAVQTVLNRYVERESSPVIRLATDRTRWGGGAGWAAFDPRDRVLWVHSSPFRHLSDATLLQAGVAHELAHGVLFILGEHRHQRTTKHPGPEWLVFDLQQRWGYNPEEAESWRRFLDDGNPRLPERIPPMAPAEFERWLADWRTLRASQEGKRAAFLAEKDLYLKFASGDADASYSRLAKDRPDLLLKVLAGELSIDEASAMPLAEDKAT